MSFDEAILQCLSKYAVFSGRAAPAEFWWFALVYLAALVLTLALLAYGSLLAGPGLVVLALCALPLLGVTVRRLHDIGVRGMLLLLMVPVLGQLVLLVWLARRGVERTNRYGPEPEKEREQFLLVAR